MKKSKIIAVIMFIITALALAVGVGMYFYQKQRLEFQSSINYIELAVSSIEEAYRYMQFTETLEKVFYIPFAIAGVTLLIGLLLTLFSYRKKGPSALTTNIPTLQNKFCPKCGTMLTDDSVFCSNCGHNLT